MYLFLLSALFVGLLSCAVTPSSQVDSQPTSTPISQAAPLPLPHTVGVLPFDYQGRAARWAWLRHGLPDMLITDLVSQFGMMIIARESLGDVLREQWLQHRGMSEAKNAVRLGRLSGARYLIKGSIYDIHKEVMVDVHMLDVERGSVSRTSRAVGSYEDIPALEKQLSGQIQEWFSLLNVDRSSDAKNVQDLSGSEPLQELNDPSAVSDVPIQPWLLRPKSSVLGLDLQLSLERHHRMREEAWKYAAQVWENALSIELNAPELGDGLTGADLSVPHERVSIPVNAYFHPDVLNNLHRALELSVPTTDKKSGGRGTLVWKGDVSARRLFAEQFRAPRRIFLRAISESGRVIGVSSSWAWRADKTVQVHDSGSIDINIWPEPIIHGKADFVKHLLARDQKFVRFDAIMALVPEERTTVSVEMMESPQSDAIDVPVRSDADMSAVRVQQVLKDWFTKYWAPPVTEFLPVHGYLPGNKRTIQLRVAGFHNTVLTAQISRDGGEALLREDIEQLLKRLVKTCLFDCRDSLEHSPQHVHFEVRVQLDLYKDLQSVALGDTVSRDH